MSFPNTLDTTTTIPVESASTPLATSHVTAHTAIQTAIIAIETLLGVTASSVAGTFNYILGEITGSDKAVGKTATQTVTNKTLGTGTKIALGSDATGDIYYNGGSGTLTRLAAGTTGYILKLVAGIPAWVAETVTVFMSTTVAGIGEIATSAEITAGTAIGGTGGPLVITPDQLAGSTPAFSGLGLTNTVRLVRLAGYSPAGNTTENTVYTTTIPANVLGANGMIRVRTPISFSTSTTAETWTIRIKFGGTTLQTLAVSCAATGGGTSINSYGFIETFIVNNAATNAQNVGTYTSLTPQLGQFPSNPNTATLGNPSDTTATIDTTSSQTLTMTVQRTNGAGGGGGFYQSIVEVIRNA